MTEVAFHVELHTARVHELRTLAQWIDLFDLEHDRTVTTWTDVYEGIALGWLAGGDYGDYVKGSYTDTKA